MPIICWDKHYNLIQTMVVTMVVVVVVVVVVVGEIRKVVVMKVMLF